MSGSSPLQSKATESTTDSSETTSTIIVVRNGTKAKNCIFFSWEDARPHIVDYKGVTYATFDDLEEAMQYLNQSKDDGNYDDKEKIGKKSYLRPIYLDSNLYKCAKEFKYHNTGFSIHWNILTKKMIISTLLKTPLIKYKMNRILTNKACTSGTNRQYKLSCKSEYTSFESLTDNSFYGRHLDPAPDSYVNSLPPIDAVAELFERQRVNNRDGTEREVQTMCPRSTMLFPTFAQHLMDSFIVTATEKGTKESRTEFDWRKTDSPHDIGLLPLYGRTIKQTKQLRVQKPPRGRYGQLKSQMINGEEWAPFLFAPCGKVKDEFNELDYPQGLDHVFEHIDCPIEKRTKKEKIFAFGGARTNLTPNVSAWNVLLLREHNRIARVIERNEPSWDDERIFQTSRNILLVIYLKLVIEEYINHITPYGTDFTVRPGKWMWNAPWYKRNWMSAEFAVLSRWHSIIPKCMSWGKTTVSTQDTLFHNNLLLNEMNGSLRAIFFNISNHRATAMGLFNTESWLVNRDKAALKQSRACKLQPYVEYVRYLGLKPPKKFSDISKVKHVQRRLKEVYGCVERIEFWPGMLASENSPDSLMSPALTKFVENDTFSQALTHPLLSENVWKNGKETFGKYGWKLVRKKHRIVDILERNTKDGESIRRYEFVGMNMPSHQHCSKCCCFNCCCNCR